VVIEMKKLLLILMFTFAAVADIYWVSPTGAATWANAKSATPLSGAACCTYSRANENVKAGDSVCLRGGTYTISGGNNYNNGIAPVASGTAEARIYYYNYAGEVPVFTGGASYNSGMYLTNVSYIKIDGITVSDVMTFGNILNRSSFNEILNCTFTSTTGYGFGFGISSYNSCATHDCWCTDNWIHHNIFTKQVGADQCAEGIDLLRIGGGYAGGNVPDQNNNNTVENNTFSYAAHTCFDNYGTYTVIRNNYSHNEPWITGCPNGQVAQSTKYDSSTTSFTIGTGSKTFAVTAGKSYPTTSTTPLSILSSDDPTKVMWGIVSSYNSGTGSLVVNVSRTLGAGTINKWYISKGNYPYYVNSDYNGKYGHRNFQLSDDYNRDGLYTLVEKNRLGYASSNPGNGGPMNIDVAAPRNIIRYNDIFAGMSSGIYFKYANADFTLRITSSSSNTVETGSKTFTTQTGLHIAVGQTIRVWSLSDKRIYVGGNVTSYSSITGELVILVAYTSGSGTHSDWEIFWNGARAGVENKVYNNTIYKNGTGYNWSIYGAMNVAYQGTGISQVNGAGEGNTNNSIINNIVYGNSGGDICEGSLTVGGAPETWDNVAGNWLTSSGNPLFLDTNISNPLDTLKPNFSLASNSPVINKAMALTVVDNADAGSGTALVVDDALYFQDGSWGSDLVRANGTMVADWIAVGSVSKTVQISAIDYETNTITLANSINRSDGDSVWLYKNSLGEIVLNGSAPDIGAHESAYENFCTVRIGRK
jgi:hypothetical protein